MAIHNTISAILDFKGDDSATSFVFNFAPLLPAIPVFPFVPKPDSITATFSTNDSRTLSSYSFAGLVGTFNFNGALSSTANMSLTVTLTLSL